MSKMSKPETAEHLKKRKEREAKQIARLEREAAKPKGPGYFAYFILIICIVYIVDEVTTQIGTQMQSVIAQKLFAPLVGANVATARLAAVGTVTGLASGLAMLYKPLSDRFGRKIFLIINTLGMGLGMLFVGISTNIPVYIAGAMFISFFTPHDMQLTYIQECVPAEKRATYYTVIKSIATLGMLMIPLFKSIFIPGTDLTRWRYCYILPAVIGILVAIFAACFIRESDAFIVSRLRYLRSSDEERATAKKNKENDDSEKGGFLNGVKYLFTHKQLRWLAICYGFVFAAYLITQYYETVMSYGFAGLYSAAQVKELSDEALTALLATSNAKNTQALFAFSFGSAAFQFFPGFIADKFGRKKCVIICSLITLGTYIAFWLGCRNGWNPYIVGFLCGAAIGSYWMTGDMVQFLLAESAPTNMRVSVATTIMIVAAPMMGVFSTIATVLFNIFGDVYIAPVSLAVMVFVLVIATVILITKVKETRGVDLGKVTGHEYD